MTIFLVVEAPWYLTVGASTTDRDIKVGIRSVSEPEGGRLKGTSYGNTHAPAVARFSSRGPTIVAKDILKPDIIGPGVKIISASNKGEKKFAILSGTSMACPHLSGAAGLIKKMHPNWSPSAIKSALMTTAYQTNLSNRTIEVAEKNRRSATPSDMGAGHVDIVKAIDPGLVFEIQPNDYIPYLCGLYLNQRFSTMISGKADCSRRSSGSSLNLPSIWVDLSGQNFEDVRRTFTNVGSSADEVYKVELKFNATGKFLISVDPQELQFSGLNSKKKFTVYFTRKVGWEQSGAFAVFMVWRSDKHVVTSPIMVKL